MLGCIDINVLLVNGVMILFMLGIWLCVIDWIVLNDSVMVVGIGMLSLSKCCKYFVCLLCIDGDIGVMGVINVIGVNCFCCIVVFFLLWGNVVKLVFVVRKR